MRWPTRRGHHGNWSGDLHASPKSQPQTLQTCTNSRRRRRIAFIDFWPGFDTDTDPWVNKNWFAKNLIHTDIVQVADGPDVVMFTLFGKSYMQFRGVASPPKLIFFTGENVRPPVAKIPLCLSFDHIAGVPAHIHTRLPLWVLNHEVHAVILMHEHRINGKMDSSVISRPGFCGWLASNPNMYNAEVRLKFVQELSRRYKQVSCGGKVLNNIGGTVPMDGKLKFLRNYRFNIAFENASHPGYCTEKLLHAFAAGCVPIYWGDPHVSKTSSIEADFNPAALISAHDFANFDDLIEHIAKVDSDPLLLERYLSQPILSNTWYERLRCWPRFCQELTDLLFHGIKD